MTNKSKIYIVFLLFFLCCIFFVTGNPLTLCELNPFFTNRVKQVEWKKSEGKVQAAIKGTSGETIKKEFLTNPAEKDAAKETPYGEEESAQGQQDRPVINIRASGSKEIPLWDEEMVRQLSFLKSPIPGASISTRDSQLPGAPRAYRNGTHEGLDYYNGYCGVSVHFGDPVYAAGAGIIYRIDHDYSEPVTVEREEMLRLSATAGDTPVDILDKFRGRQVWIVHAFGVVTRYAHLDTVSDQLQVGDWVEAGTFIGTVGNSGTSNGARGIREDAHLHFEIWVENCYLGEGLSPGEVRLLWQQVLDGN